MNNALQHHGIKGQKWGVRRFQNSDGSLTAKGKSRYQSKENKEYGKREDSVSYKYNKSNESGWIGLGRAMTAAGKSAVSKGKDFIDKRIEKQMNRYLSKEDMEYGKREDSVSYKYNKSNESGQVGLKRAAIRKR